MDTVTPLPVIVPAPLAPVRSTSAEWDVTHGKESEAQAKDAMRANVRAGIVRKISHGGIPGGERSPLMKKRGVDDRESDLKEESERKAAARIVDGQTTGEQLRRIAEASAEKTAANKLEMEERKKAAARAKAEEESERLRRIQEHSTLTVEAQAEASDAERSKAKARGMTAVEQNRRIAEAASLKSEAKAEETAERKKALAEVRAAEEIERRRRMAEREGDMTPAIIAAAERHERKKSVDMAVLMMEAERARRLGEDAHEKEGEKDEGSRDAMKVWVEKEVEKERGRRMSWGTRPAGLLAALARPI